MPAVTPTPVDPALVAVLLSPWAKIAAFVWGALWGSFANVVVHRVPLGLSVLRPRSRCPACETPIAAWDNIPIVSYLVLRGRCRHCKEPYSVRYLVVELLAGMLSFALYLQWVQVPLVEGGDASAWAWLLHFTFGLALLAVIQIDLAWWIIPNVIVLPLAVVGFVASFWRLVGVDPFASGAAALTGYGLFAGLRAVYLRWRGIEALGLGDAKLLLMVGAFTGPAGLLWTIGGGAVQGLLVSVPMLLAGRNVAHTDLHEIHGDDPELGEEDPNSRVMGRRVPFGPFLGMAALEWVLVPRQIEWLLVRTGDGMVWLVSKLGLLPYIEGGLRGLIG